MGKINPLLLPDISEYRKTSRYSEKFESDINIVTRLPYIVLEEAYTFDEIYSVIFPLAIEANNIFSLHEKPIRPYKPFHYTRLDEEQKNNLTQEELEIFNIVKTFTNYIPVRGGRPGAIDYWERKIDIYKLCSFCLSQESYNYGALKVPTLASNLSRYSIFNDMPEGKVNQYCDFLIEGGYFPKHTYELVNSENYYQALSSLFSLYNLSGDRLHFFAENLISHKVLDLFLFNRIKAHPSVSKRTLALLALVDMSLV
jgi:hypothetical protein